MLAPCFDSLELESRERASKSQPKLHSEDVMSGRGKKFKFHGSFKSKAKAKRKEETCNCFIKKLKVRGKPRFAVLERL